MHKLVLVLSCLVCLTAAGHLGLERKLLWLQNLSGVSQHSKQAKQDQAPGMGQLPSVSKRQQFLLDILLQVQKPLVNTQLIELGKELNIEPLKYKQPEDENLLGYLSHAQEHLLLGRNRIYSELNVQHTRQLIGLYKFLVLAADWSIFQRNVCFARLHMNPVVFVHALHMAVRDRGDTQDLLMPAMQEVLPQLFYDQDVISAAQNVDWGQLITKSNTIKPNLLDVLGLRGLSALAPGHVLHLGKSGLWHPWQEWRLKMIGAKTAGVGDAVVAAPKNALLLSEEQKIVVQVEQTNEMSYLINDPALHVFWNQVMNERLLQKLSERRQQLIEGQQQDHVNIERQMLDHAEHVQNWQQIQNGVNVDVTDNTNMNNWQDVQNKNNDADMSSNRRNDKSTENAWKSSEQVPKLGGVRSSTQTGMWQDQRKISNWKNDKTGQDWRMSQSGQQIELGNQNWQGVSAVDTDQLPVSHTDNARLLHVSRRRMQQNTENRNQDTTPQHNSKWIAKQASRTWHNMNDDTEEGLTGSAQTGSWNVNGRWTGMEHGREMQDDVQTTAWNPRQKQLNGEQNWTHKNQQNDDDDGNVANDDVMKIAGHKRQTLWHNQQQVKKDQTVTTAEHDHNTNIEGNRFVSDRTVRSIDMLNTIDISPTEELMSVRSGEILMHNLQQLQARLHMEQLALSVEQKDNTADDQQQPRLITTNGRRYERGSLDEATISKRSVQAVVQQLRSVIDAELQQQQVHSGSEQVLKVIGDILVGHNGQLGNTWEELITQLNQAIYGVGANGEDKTSLLTTSTGNLRAPICQQLLGQLVQLIDDYKSELQPYAVQDLLLEGIRVVDVQVDHLITHMELVDTDLINLVDQQLLQSHVNNVEKLQKKVVARQQRLNHQPFTVSMQIDAQQQQRVVMRTFLLPQVDRDGRALSVAAQRQHFLLLDAFVHTLQSGSNRIQRGSQQINWTTRDVSTLSELYHRVMTGQSPQQLVGSSCRFPQHLLIPRGTVDGLPVQLIVLVTPVAEQDAVLQRLVNKERLCGMGIAGIGLDRLPLGFPLDRPIQNEQQLMLPNVRIHNTFIQHDDRVRVTRI